MRKQMMMNIEFPSLQTGYVSNDKSSSSTTTGMLTMNRRSIQSFSSRSVFNMPMVMKVHNQKGGCSACSRR